MAWPPSVSSISLLCLICIIFFAHPSHAFGAGNIGSTSKIEGQNWRHGDIEDTLLTLLISLAAGGKKFSKLDVKRVYFGNWLRDYSQAVDVGTVKYVSAEAIRILLWVLGFMSFGYGTKEFEVTTARLGCYRPEEHIDNPKDYADNLDARQYDRRLRGPVDERRELSIDPETGLKNYIASENLRIATSAGLVRKLFGRSIQLGRQYARSKNKEDLYEALRLLGTGCHCLEDFSAHSNFTELVLIELGERDIFPHVGRSTQINLHGARHSVYPLVTGTFGGVDFLHSVMGEFDDKTTQSEIQELEDTMQNSRMSDTSVLQDLLNKVPEGVFGDKDEAGKASELQSNAQAHQMQNTRVTPREPEEWTQYLDDVQKQIYPIIEWHDEIMKSITETIEKIPLLPDLIEQIQDQINIFVFSLLAPFVVPIINQVKAELNTGSSEIIRSSIEKQHIVFHDNRSSDPTHSMLSKDHFSNILNEPAGKVASQVLKWVVPQLIACWDDESIDVDRTLNRVITGILHHPALRDYGQDGASDGRRLMFGVVEQWWRQKDETERSDLREQLSREGVESGKNHKPGQHDTGHGCGRPLGMSNLAGTGGMGSSSATTAAMGGISSMVGGGSSQPIGGSSNQLGKLAGQAVGGGVLGGVVGGLVGGVGSNLLGGSFDDDQTQTYKRENYDQDGSYNQTYTQVGQGPGRRGQAQYTRTEQPHGGRREEYSRYEQEGGDDGYGVTKIRESRPTHGGGYEQTTETRRNYGERRWDSEVRREERTSEGKYRQETKRYSSSGYKEDSDDSDDEDSYKKKKKHGKEHNKHSDDEDSDDDKRRSGYGRDENRYRSGGNEYASGRQQGYGQETSSYGGGFGSRSEETYEPPTSSRGAYGQQSYRRYVEEESTSGAYGQQPARRYGEDESSRRGYGEGTRQYGEEEPSLGGFGGSGFGQQSRGYGEEDIPSYGRAGGDEHTKPSRRYGEETTMPGGFGGDDESGHGREPEGRGYAGRREGGYGQGSSSGYGARGDETDMPGGFGGGDEYGEQQSEGYGGSRYGRRSGGYGSEE